MVTESLSDKTRMPVVEKMFKLLEIIALVVVFGRCRGLLSCCRVNFVFAWDEWSVLNVYDPVFSVGFKL